MTERERWIVYPLLFLALGAALRDKLIDRTVTKSIVCQELSIVDEGSTGPQSQRTLARIGRKKPISGGPSVGYLEINGDVEVVNDDISDTAPTPFLVKLGHTFAAPNAPPTGYAIVRGELLVDGNINARQYSFQGIPFVPLQIVPGVTMPNVLPAMPHPATKVPNPKAPNPKAPSQAPPNEAKKDQASAQPPAPAGDQAAPAK